MIFNVNQIRQTILSKLDHKDSNLYCVLFLLYSTLNSSTRIFHCALNFFFLFVLRFFLNRYSGFSSHSNKQLIDQDNKCPLSLYYTISLSAAYYQICFIQKRINIREIKIELIFRQFLTTYCFRYDSLRISNEIRYNWLRFHLWI